MSDKHDADAIIVAQALAMLRALARQAGGIVVLTQAGKDSVLTLLKDQKETADDALGALERIEVVLKRYAWLRDGNAYAPEENYVRGGAMLDKLCDEEGRGGPYY